jgi:hypothetical protein
MVRKTSSLRPLAIALLAPAGKCDDDDPLPAFEFADSLGCFNPIHARHPDIKQHQMRPKTGGFHHSRLPAMRYGNLLAQQRQQTAQTVGRIDVVIDHEHPRPFAPRCFPGLEPVRGYRLRISHKAILSRFGMG